MLKVTDLLEELLDEIFSYLHLEYVLPAEASTLYSLQTLQAFHDGDLPELATVPMMAVLAQVCRTFYAIASRRLHEHIVICSPEQTDRLAGRLAIIRRNESSSNTDSNSRGAGNKKRTHMLSFTVFPRRAMYTADWSQVYYGRFKQERTYKSLLPYVGTVRTVAIYVLSPLSSSEGGRFSDYLPLLRIFDPSSLILFSDYPPRAREVLDFYNKFYFHCLDLSTTIDEQYAQLEYLQVSNLSVPGSTAMKQFLEHAELIKLRRLVLVSPKGLDSSRIVDLLAVFQGTLSRGGLTIRCTQDWRTDDTVDRMESGCSPRAWFEQENEKITLEMVKSEVLRRDSGELLSYLKWEVEA